MNNKCLVVPVRFTATLTNDGFSESIADTVLEVLDIQADEREVATTVRMLDLTNRSANYVTDRLDNELVYDNENAIIFNIGGRQSKGAPSPMWTKGLLKHIEKLRLKSPESIIICVFSCSFNTSAIEFHHVEHSIQTHNMTAVYNDGTVIFKSCGGGKLGQTTEDAIAAVYREDPAAKHERLINSFTRRPGAFRFDAQSAVYPFSYSVSKNRSEIIDIVASQISEACHREEVNIITYWSNDLWFGQIIEHLASDERLRLISFQNTTRSDMGAAAKAPYIHFVPFFGTGSDVVSAIDLTSHKPASVVSIGRTITTNKPDENNQKSKRLSLSSGGSILAEYIFSVPGTSCELVELWREVNIAETQFDPATAEQWIKSWRISPLSFWAMALESGFSKEGYGPERDMLENVPPMRKLVANNGSYLAEKIIAFTEDEFGSPPNRSVIFVRIDEEGTEPLNEILGNAMDRVVISVPRDLLRGIDNQQVSSLDDLSGLDGMAALVESFVISFDHALQEVGCTKSDQAKVVILDEFTFSGASMHLLSQLMKMRNVEFCSRLALFDFGNGANDNDTNCLYHLPLV